MPILNYRDGRWKTYYDVLDAVRALPAVYLAGVNEDWIRGTRMARLQAFLSGLHFAGLDEGHPPFRDFGPWVAVQTERISDSHNMPFHWLEQTEGDAAFDTFFVLLDEFRACSAAIIQRHTGPFCPDFKVGVDDPQPPRLPNTLLVGRYEPSNVWFWTESYSDNDHRNFPFCRSLSAARRAASERWGVSGNTWEHV